MPVPSKNRKNRKSGSRIDRSAVERSPSRVDKEEAPTPQAAALVLDAAAVLRAMPRMFYLARMATGVAAIAFEHIRSHHSYRIRGFATMRQYATEELHIDSEAAYDKARKAGRKAWTTIPDRCREVMARLLDGSAPALDLPHVPNQSVLMLLPRALKKASDPKQLLADALNDRCTVATLEQILRRAETPTAAEAGREPDPARAVKQSPGISKNKKPPMSQVGHVLQVAERPREAERAACDRAPPDAAATIDAANRDLDRFLDELDAPSVQGGIELIRFWQNLGEGLMRVGHELGLDPEPVELIVVEVRRLARSRARKNRKRSTKTKPTG